MEFEATAIPMYDQKGRVLTQEQRKQYARKMGLCFGCGLKTHEVKRFLGKKPLNNEDVSNGICLPCLRAEEAKKLRAEEAAKKDQMRRAQRAQKEGFIPVIRALGSEEAAKKDQMWRAQRAQKEAFIPVIRAPQDVPRRERGFQNVATRDLTPIKGDEAPPLIMQRDMMARPEQRKVNVAPQISIPICIRIDTKRLRLGNKAGSGGFAVVFSGTYTTHRGEVESVAFKRFRVEEAELSERDITSIDRELDVLRSFQLHENIVSLLGACSDPGASDANGSGVGFGIMLELADLGSLRKYLVSSKSDKTSSLLQSILLDAARGMLALHSQRPHPIIHRDLKSMNILLFSKAPKEGILAKIADFGLACAVTSSSAATASKVGVGTLNWNAPETITDNKYSVGSDIWSFGMVMYEVATCCLPYDDDQAPSIMWKITGGQLPDLSKITCPFDDSVSNLMKACWNSEAKERPRFSRIVECLSDSLGEEPSALRSLRVGSVDDRLEAQRKLRDLKEQLDSQAAHDAEKFNEAWEALNAEKGSGDFLKMLSKFAKQYKGTATQPAHVSSVDDLLTDGEVCEQDLHGAMQSVVEAAGGVYMRGELKERKRIESKTMNEYEGDFRRVVDVVRATGVFDSLSQTVEIVKQLEMSPCLSVIRCKDRFNKPLSSGYRDLVVNVVRRDSNGPPHVAELQVNLKPMSQIKEFSHRVYELQRAVGWVPS